jgi:hypothetical protein
MSTPILDLNNSANWENHYHGSFEGGQAIVNGRTIYAPILETNLPIAFEKRIIAVYAISASAKPTWNFAGYISQKIKTGLVIGSVPESLVERRPFWLNQITLLFLPQVASTYALSITPAKWLKDISLYTWQYIGAESDTTEVVINNIQTTVNQIYGELSDS